MRPQHHDLDLYRGDTYGFEVKVFDGDGKPVDLSGATVDMDIRPAHYDPVSPDIQVAKNSIKLHFPAALTRDAGWTRADYDLRLLLGDAVITLLYGKVMLTRDVTKMSGGAGVRAVGALSVTLTQNFVPVSLEEPYDPSMLAVIDFYLENGKQ